MNKHSALLKLLSEAPDSQIDSAITLRLKAMADDPNPKADTLHEILDECAYASLASDFGMTAMNVVWSELLADEGRTVEEALAARHPH